MKNPVGGFDERLGRVAIRFVTGSREREIIGQSPVKRHPAGLSPAIESSEFQFRSQPGEPVVRSVKLNSFLEINATDKINVWRNWLGEAEDMVPEESVYRGNLGLSPAALDLELIPDVRCCRGCSLYSLPFDDEPGALRLVG